MPYQQIQWENYLYETKKTKDRKTGKKFDDIKILSSDAQIASLFKGTIVCRPFSKTCSISVNYQSLPSKDFSFNSSNI